MGASSRTILRSPFTGAGRRWMLQIGLLWLLCSGGAAQIREAGDLNPHRGVSPTGLFRTGDLDTVNLNTGAVALKIPITAFPGNRGGAPGFELSLNSNSAAYDVRADYSKMDQNGRPELTYNLQPSRNNGWRYSYEYSLEWESRPNPEGSFNCANPLERYQANHMNRLTLVLPDGSRHLLRLRLAAGDDSNDGYYRYDPLGHLAVGCGPAGPNLSGNLTYYTTDGTYLSVAIMTGQLDGNGQPLGMISLRWSLYFPDGSVLTQDGFTPGSPLTLKDRNGNGISVYSGTDEGYLAHFIVDEAGRQITVQKREDQSQHWVKTQGGGGKELKWVVHWREAVGVRREYECTASRNERCELLPSNTVVDHIDIPKEYCDNELPCGLKYEFAYNTDNTGGGLANVSAVTTPLGAQTRFAFRLDASTGYLYTWDEYLNDWVSQRIASIPRDYPAADETTTYTFANVNEVNAPGGATTKIWVDSSTAKRGLSWKTQYPDGSTVERYWKDNSPSSVISDSNNFNNPYVKAEYRTVAGKTRMTVYDYDLNGNATSVAEYDWFDATARPIPRDALGMPNGIVSGVTLLRTTAMTYQFPAPPGSETYAYYAGAEQRYRAAMASTRVEGAGVESKTELRYTPAVAALLVSLQVSEECRWDSTKSPTVPGTLNDTNAACWRYTYYPDSGSLKTATPPGGSPWTEYGYDASSSMLSYRRTSGGGLVLEARFEDHDRWIGLPKKTIPDTANAMYISTEYDAFGRAVTVREGVTDTQVARRAETVYSLQNRRIVTKSSVDGAEGSWRWRVTAQHFDGAGRLWRSRELETGNVDHATGSNDTGMITDTQQGVWSAGRWVAVSNPYRPGGDDPRGWALSCLDRIGRVTDTYEVPGTTPPACGSVAGYTARSTTAYDQPLSSPDHITERMSDVVEDAAGSSRRLAYDGLRRLKTVWEAPGALNYRTEYTYDARDNLRTVQHYDGAGSLLQTRSFDYDSLRRLWRAIQPESGTLTYTYSDDGKLRTRQDGRGVVVTYSYDGLDRPLTTTYAGIATSAVRYCYDGWKYDAAGGCVPPGTPIAYSHGRLTEVRNDVSAARFLEFDALGRVTKSEQETGGSGRYAFGYKYNSIGLVEMTYHSGRVVTTAYDGAGRPATVAAGGFQYLKPQPNENQYWAFGGLRRASLGNGRVERWDYNTQRQPVSIDVSGLLNIGYSYRPGQNNGNVQQQVITVPGQGTFTQTYGYDGLNRLNSVSETAEGGATGSWSAGFAYDALGNMWVTSPMYPPDLGTPSNGAQYSSATNRLLRYANGQMLPADTYDAAGNLRKEPWLPGTGELVYDGENHLVSHTREGTVVTYSYDGEGRRVRRVGSNGTTTYVYDALGRLAEEYGPPEPSPCGEPRCFVSVDHLGSTRLLAGTGTTLRRFDYRPFGEEVFAGEGGRTTAMGYTAARDQFSRKFTGQERDAETGLDYFGARYFSGAQGRFTSPDDPLAGAYPSNPQSWNRYAYAFNNPLLFVDPDGHEPCVNDVNPENGNICTVVVAKAPVTTEEKVKASVKSTLNLAVDLLNITPAGLLYWHLAGKPGVERMQPSTPGEAPQMRVNSVSADLMMVGELVIPEKATFIAAAIANDTGQLTRAGRALQKHGSRAGSYFPAPVGGPAQLNEAGLRIVDSILDDPGRLTRIRHHARFGEILEIRSASGQGVRFSSDGKQLIGFIE